MSPRKPRARGNGQGSIFDRPDGLIGVAVHMDGKRVVKYAHTKSQAERLLQEMLAARDRGELATDPRLTVAEYLAHWLTVTRPNLAPATWQRYEQLARLHAVPVIGEIRLARLRPVDLQRLYSRHVEEGMHATTLHHLHRALHRAFALAVRWELLPRNPADRVDAPQSRVGQRQALTPAQARQLLAAASGHRLEALVVCALTLGMREGEICGLAWEQVDLERGLLAITQASVRDGKRFVIGPPKTPGSVRTLALPQIAADALGRRRQAQREERIAAGSAWQDTGLVFTRADGTAIARWHLASEVLAPLLAAAGLPRVTVHDLRHTYATLGFQAGLQLKAVSETLGHSRIGVTGDLYQHTYRGMSEQVAAVMDRLFSGPTVTNGATEAGDMTGRTG